MDSATTTASPQRLMQHSSSRQQEDGTAAHQRERMTSERPQGVQGSASVEVTSPHMFWRVVSDTNAAVSEQTAQVKRKGVLMDTFAHEVVMCSSRARPWKYAPTARQAGQDDESSGCRERGLGIQDEA